MQHMNKLFFLLLLVLAAAWPAQAQVAVVVNPGVPVAKLDKNQLSNIYALEQAKWGNGARVVAFNLESKADAFFSAIGGSHADYKKTWLRMKLSGEGQPPQALKTDADVIAQVSSTPGAIGFVSAASVTDKVKVVATF